MIGEQTFEVKDSAIVQMQAGVTNVLKGVVSGFVIQTKEIRGGLNL